MKTFFDRVFGFSEDAGFDATRATLAATMRVTPEEDGGITFFGNVQAGRFETPSLGELRARVASLERPPPRATIIKNVVGIAGPMHIDPAYDGAVFQAASGLNCLEFANPFGKPEDGIGCYMSDHTQGPACAIACAGGTAFRNYFTGQTRMSQLNMMSGLEAALVGSGHPWAVVNGYIEATSEEQLAAFNARLMADPTLTDTLKSALRIGVQWHAQATSAPHHQIVTQTYNSACAVGYSRKANPGTWAPLSCLVLDASYEATMLVSVIENARREKMGLPPKPCLLTKVGGGVFRNEASWIIAAVARGAEAVRAAGHSVECHIVHYKSLDAAYADAFP